MSNRLSKAQLKEMESRWEAMQVVCIGKPGAVGVNAVWESMERNLTPLVPVAKARRPAVTGNVKAARSVKAGASK